MQRKLKLFVWERVFCDYLCGIAFALAETPEEARELILGKSPNDLFMAELSKDPSIYEWKIGFLAYGASQDGK